MELICTIKEKSRVNNMWFRYFVTFFNIFIVIILWLYASSLKFPDDKIALKVLGTIIVSYIVNTVLIWK